MYQIYFFIGGFALSSLLHSIVRLHDLHEIETLKQKLSKKKKKNG